MYVYFFSIITHIYISHYVAFSNGFRKVPLWATNFIQSLNRDLDVFLFFSSQKKFLFFLAINQNLFFFNDLVKIKIVKTTILTKINWFGLENHIQQRNMGIFLCWTMFDLWGKKLKLFVIKKNQYVFKEKKKKINWNDGIKAACK